MASSKRSGDLGEREVVKKVKCPNCASKLTLLPPSFPMYDVQCTRCLFRAQVKTARCRPKDQLFGAGWDIIEKNLKAGHLVPPLIVNFRWQEAGRLRQTIYFFPFIARANLRDRQRSADGARPAYREFNYVGLLDQKTPKMILLDEGFSPQAQRARKRSKAV